MNLWGRREAMKMQKSLSLLFKTENVHLMLIDFIFGKLLTNSRTYSTEARFSHFHITKQYHPLTSVLCCVNGKMRSMRLLTSQNVIFIYHFDKRTAYFNESRWKITLQHSNIHSQDKSWCKRVFGNFQKNNNEVWIVEACNTWNEHETFFKYICFILWKTIFNLPLNGMARQLLV